MTAMDWYYVGLGFMAGWFWSLFVITQLGGKHE